MIRKYIQGSLTMKKLEWIVAVSWRTLLPRMDLNRVVQKEGEGCEIAQGVKILPCMGCMVPPALSTAQKDP